MIVVRLGCLSVITQGGRETMKRYEMAVTGIYREEKSRRDVKPLSSRTAVYLTKTLSFTLQKHSRLRRSQHSQYSVFRTLGIRVSRCSKIEELIINRIRRNGVNRMWSLVE